MAWFHPERISGTPPPPRTGHAAVCLDGVRVLVRTQGLQPWTSAVL